MKSTDLFPLLGDVGSVGSPGPPGPSSASPSTLNPISLMSLFSTTTDLAHYLAETSDKNTPLDTSNQQNTDGNSLATASKFLDDLKHLSDRINLRLKPDGSQLYPARSCRDIADYYPEKSNGCLKFFIFHNI